MSKQFLSRAVGLLRPILPVLLIIVLSAGVIGFDASRLVPAVEVAGGLCLDPSTNDAQIAEYRGISLETINLLHTQRGLTSEDICIMPQEKLERAIFRANNPKPDKPDEAIAFRNLQLQDENGFIPPDAYQKAAEHIDNMRAAQQSANTPDGAGINPGSWSWIGPGNIGGRVRSLLIHPTSPDIMWTGSVSGGVWKTTNGGSSWFPLDDFMSNLAVSTLVMSPTNPDVIFAGTGEGFFNGDGLRGAGVFKTTDGGASWNQLASTTSSDWHYVNRLAIDPNNADNLLAATNTGIFQSTNGGTSWNQTLFVRTLDLDFHPTDSTKAVASGSFGGAWYSTNGGDSWTPATGFPPGLDFYGRIEVAYARSNPNIVYASAGINNGEVWKSTDGGQSYAKATTVANSYLGSQGWYDNIIWVDPTNPDNLIVGGIDLWRSTNGGSTLTKISQWFSAPTSAHADHHIIVQHPGFNGTSNKTVFFGNDGGIYRANDFSTVSNIVGWQELNNELGITQFYGAAGNATSGIIVGGTQDNGTLRYSGGSETWTDMFGGDGGFSASDPTDPNYFYGEYVYLTIHRSTNGGVSSNFIYSGIGDANVCANFIAPFILDPNNANTMLGGGCSLWRSTNVKAAVPGWGSIKASVGSNISAIAVAQGNSDVIWVGHNNGHIYKTTNGTNAVPTWDKMDDNTPSLPNRYVHRITVHPTNPDIVYVTFGGFSPDNIWLTTDGGANWTQATGGMGTSLPSAPVRSLVIHPTNHTWIYAGTEVGVFASEDSGANWFLPGDGPANVSVDELFWMGTKLVAATHGRGLYTTETDNASVSLEVADIRYSDAAGNNDGIIDPGETIAVEVDLSNTGVDPATGVSGLFGYTRGSLTLGNINSSYPDIAAGATATNNSDYTFTVNATPDACGPMTFEHYLTFNTTEAFTHTFSLHACDPAPVLLVDDDDDSPNVSHYYTSTLDALGVPYYIWDTYNSDDEPDAVYLSTYDKVIWFSGDAYASGGGPAGPGPDGEAALADFLDSGKCLFISSQDYEYDKGFTPFMMEYLGVDSIADDVGHLVVTGTVGTIFDGMGPYTLDYATPGLSNYNDVMTPTLSAGWAFDGDREGAAVYLDSGVFRTAFLGFPFETLPSETDREATLDAFLNWCDAQANFEASTTTGSAPLTVVFTNTSTTGYVTSMWDFGDGATSTEDSPTHTFTNVGTYTVTLSVDALIWSDTLVRTSYITVTYAPVVADFSATPTIGGVPLEVVFTNLSSGDFSDVTWDFGDGNTSTDDSPIHIYMDAGTYTVTLTANGPGGTDTATKVGYIRVGQGTVYLPLVGR